MIRAILDGRKTQTRRVVKPTPLLVGGIFYENGIGRNESAMVSTCPYGVPGDRLWVREGFWIQHDSEWDESRHQLLDCGIRLAEDDWAAVQYCASPENPDEPGPGDWFGPDDVYPERVWIPWGPDGATKCFSRRSSIHMPRWASRITLEVTEVRVQPLQAISEEDALDDGGWSYADCPVHKNPRASFEALWDSINAKRGYPWSANPWVWAVSFRSVQP